jgi:transcriptional regulator with XRE-family HTH domain
MAPSDDQRHLLGAFLRARREALNPVPAGQSGAPNGRRRTPGLRREEVAQLCGISTTWYTWIQQGRDIALSAGALARLADTLQLTTAERGYMFELARRRDPAPRRGETAPVAAASELVAVVRATTAPAYVLDPLWYASARNDAAGHLFAPWFDSGEACLLRFVFLEPAARTFIWDWEDRARRLLAEFRADTARDPQDAGTQALIEALLSESQAFARFWHNHAVLAREGGARRFNHPRDGTLEYEQITLVPAAHPGWKVVILLEPTTQRAVPVRPIA